MQFTLDQNPKNYGIHAYAQGEITITIPRTLDEDSPLEIPDNITRLHIPVRRENLTRSLVLMPDRLIRDWPPQNFSELSAEHFATLSELDIEIMLFGSGATTRWPALPLLAPLIDQGIGVEVMDTGAACRTYNILMSDQRKFAAAFLMI